MIVISGFSFFLFFFFFLVETEGGYTISGVRWE